ncbi:Glycosyltransferase involved in cell wall bisynthesis [Clostridium cochlearium]|uniref:Glycosyltransferase involved in cell wall bisynthesis n=1 Tax=Clostridium cochlearium TaxID=1494 RepID=A0ABY0QMM4_CLOCO|nr:glycosyltransferase family 2 protein [Clostridium cochlearium]SDL28405.1 Glycosyltransferase involved in cell wall bisynthesis [Clostridium cochlearium]
MSSEENKNISGDLVSIIMPAYNCERYIEDAINSVIAQTYNSWELIVIDDGSKDNTVRIIEELSNKDYRIRFYKNEKNLGVSETRNRGISLAKGEWIAFLDSDDMWEDSKLEKQIKLSNKVGAEFVFTGSSFINECGDNYKGILKVPEKVNYKKLRTHNIISCSSVLIKKKFFKDIRMEKDDMHEDYAVWLRVLKTGIYAYGINEPLLIYRISPNSKSGKKIKTIKMTYKVFRFIGMNSVGSAYFMFRHVIGSIMKYKDIKYKSY